MNKETIYRSNIWEVATKFISGLVLVLLFVLLFGAFNTSSAAAVDYTIRSGDTLWLLAQRYQISVDRIQNHNGIYSTIIYPGQTLTIPFQGRVHVVSRGDTIAEIARWYGVTVQDIQWSNNYWSETIYPGQRFAIPDASGSGKTGDSDQSATTTSTWLSGEQEDLLARLVRSEAEGEPYRGQVAVAAVVLNRMNSSIFPDSVTEVVYEPRQFEPVMNNTIYIPANDTARRAVREARAGWDPSRGALYFFNPAKTSNEFMHSRPPIVTIGNHKFTH